MEAIVYTSKTGFTRHYAQCLSEKTGVPCMELKVAKKCLEKGADIIYMGWVFAGSVKNYKKIAAMYTIKAVGIVGMNPNKEEGKAQIVEKNEMDSSTAFYLPGGFDKTRLSGIYKMMMTMMEKTVRSDLEKKENPPEQDVAMLKALEEGCDFFDEGYLEPLVALCGKIGAVKNV